MADKLTVKYQGGARPKLDKKITKFFHKNTNFKWYAQGFDFKTKMRDLNFEEKP